MSSETTQFKKGRSGNPSGRAKEDPAIRAFKQTTYRDFIEHLQKYGCFTREEMAAELKRPEATMFEIMFGQIVASAARGDKEARSLLLDRLWGKVKDVQDINFSSGEEIKKLSTDQLVELAKHAVKITE